MVVCGCVGDGFVLNPDRVNILPTQSINTRESTHQQNQKKPEKSSRLPPRVIFFVLKREQEANAKAITLLPLSLDVSGERGWEGRIPSLAALLLAYFTLNETV
jgi:hypothetical protein